MKMFHTLALGAAACALLSTNIGFSIDDAPGSGGDGDADGAPTGEPGEGQDGGDATDNDGHTDLSNGESEREGQDDGAGENDQNNTEESGDGNLNND